MKKKKCTKKLLAAILCVAVSLTAVPIPAMAAADQNVAEEKLRKDSPDFVIEDGVLKKYQGKGGDVVIPEEVTSIGESAFFGCSSLKSVTLPEGVKSIEWYAFGGCSGLVSVTIPEGVTNIGSAAFSGCSSLISVTLPKGITFIASSAFSDCKSLTSITIPEGVTSIGSFAFNRCSNLASISITDSVTQIGDFAFAGTKWLSEEKKKSPLVTISHILIDGTGAKGSVVIPEGVKRIAANAFWKCNTLTSVKIPEGVTVIDACAFNECRYLTSVTLPKSMKTIDEGAFADCDRLKSITLPEGIERIYTYAFGKCTSLTSITIPKSLTNIEWDTFMGCSNLTSIIIPKSVTSIGHGAFSGCNKLTIYGSANSKAQSYAKQVKIPFVVIDSAGRRNISSAVVSIKPYTYTGKAIKPTKGITVKLGRKTLVYNRDYKITKYANNTNPGTAKVTITGIGNHIGTKIATFKINLAKPGSVKQSARTTTSIKLSWKKVPGATSYVVERAPYGSKKFKKTATVKTTSYTNKKLATGQFYQYRVRAYCGKSASAYSKTVTANTSISTPSISKVTSPRKKQAVVTWKKTKGVTGYQVYRATSKNGKYKKVATVKSTKYTDKMVSRKKTYYYKVRAYKKVKSKTIYSSYSKAKGKKVK